MKFYTNVTRQGNAILEIGYDKGVKFSKVTKYKPYLFVENNTASEYKTIEGKPLKKLNFDSISAAYAFTNKYKDVSGFEIYGSTEYVYNYIYENYTKGVEYDTSQIKVCYLDIEVKSDNGFPTVDKADNVVTAITLLRDSVITVFGLGEFKVTPEIREKYKEEADLIHYIKCSTEVELLTKFIDHWSNPANHIDIVSGWAIETFDIPYLVNRIVKILGKEMANKLSPWRKLNSRSAEIFGRDTTIYTPEGISVIDYMAMYKKFVLEPRESYTLNYISYVEIGEKKMDYSEHASLSDLYTNDHQKYIEYNIHDTVLVFRLDKARDLFGILFSYAYSSRTNYIDALGSIKPWDTMMTNELMNQKVAVPQQKHDDFPSIHGAYVKEPITGKHDNVVSFDLTSLYPMLMIMFNMSADTYVTKLNSPQYNDVDDMIAQDMYNHPDIRKWINSGHLVTANMCVFSNKKQGIMPKMIKERFDQRKKIKDEMIRLKKLHQDNMTDEVEAKIKQLNNAQHAIKIQINSVYGVVANKYFRWSSPDVAQSVTHQGQYMIKHIEKEINKFLNQLCNTTNYDYVIAADTDSIYLRLSNLLSAPNEIDSIDKLDGICRNRIKPFIDEVYNQLGELVGATFQTMEMKREAICSRVVWFSKKRYVARIHDQEGVRYSIPETKIVGSEAIRSSTPEVCRKYIKRAYELILDDDLIGLRSFIKEKKQEFNTLQFDQVAFPRSVNGILEYTDKNTIYKKATPIAVKGALLYNKHVKDKGLEKRLKVINEGEKIKFAYLKIPNPIHNTVISVPEMLSNDLGLTEYIDYDMQFQKAFMDPIETILKQIGWELTPRVGLPI